MSEAAISAALDVHDEEEETDTESGEEEEDGGDSGVEKDIEEIYIEEIWYRVVPFIRFFFSAKKYLLKKLIEN